MIRATQMLAVGILLLVAHFSPAQASISQVQSPCNNYQEGTTNPSCSLASAVGSGNLIVVVALSENNSPLNMGYVSGAGGCAGTFTYHGASYTDPVGIAFWTRPASSNSVCTVTWDKASTSEPATIVAYELTDWDGIDAVDGAPVFASGTGSSLTVAMSSTTTAVDFLIGAIGSYDPTNVAYSTPVPGWSTSVTAANTSLNAAIETVTTVTAGAYTAGWSSISNAWSRPMTMGAIAIRGFPTSPTIRSTTPSSAVRNGASLTLNGVLLKAAGNSTVTFGGVSQTVTTQSSTAPVITVARGANKYGVPLPLILTDSTSAASNTWTGTSLLPQSGWAFVNLGTLASSGSRITAVSDLASGDQLAYDTQSGRVVVNPDGTFVADGTVTSFSVEAWTSGSGWGTAGLQTIN
jgi:hypothetical protein